MRLYQRDALCGSFLILLHQSKFTLNFNHKFQKDINLTNLEPIIISPASRIEISEKRIFSITWILLYQIFLLSLQRNKQNQFFYTKKRYEKDYIFVISCHNFIYFLL